MIDARFRRAACRFFLLTLGVCLPAIRAHAQVFPEATCIEYLTAPDAGYYIAHFSYLNSYSSAKSIIPGAPQNVLTTSPSGLAEPGSFSNFSPGYHANAQTFYALLTDTVTWKIVDNLGNTSTATALPVGTPSPPPPPITNPPTVVPVFVLTPVCDASLRVAAPSFAAAGTYTHQFLGQVDSGPPNGATASVFSGVPTISISNLSYVSNDPANPTSSQNPNSIYGDITIGYSPDVTSNVRLQLTVAGAVVAKGLLPITYTGPTTPQSPAISFSVPDKTYGMAPFTVSATSNSTGAITYSVFSGPAQVVGSTVTLTGAGAVELRASQAAVAGVFSAGTQDAIFVVAKESGLVTLTGLTQPYTGSPIQATSTTTPSGLAVTYTYNGSATPPTALGSHTVVGTISDANYQGSATGTLVITKASTTTTVTASANPSLAGNNVAFTATVSPSSATATTVTFTNTFGGTVTPLGTATLTGGVATINAALSTNGSHTIQATYAATTDYSASSGTLAETIYTPDSTSTQLAPNPSAVVYGNSTLLTASVTDTSSPATTPTGTVTFYATLGTSTITLGTFTLVNGTVTATYSPATLGSEGLTVVYTPANPLAFNTSSGSSTLSTSLASSSISWDPSTTKIYTGTALGSGVLNATDSIPASIAYSAYLMPSGTASTVNPATILTAGSYGLTATVTPTNMNYPATVDTLLFTVQNMNLFVSNSTGNVVSLYNNGTPQSGVTAGGGIGSAVDSSGYVWSINSSGSSLSKFTNAGSLAGTYSGGGLSGGTALAVDGLGQVWVTNGNGMISEFTNTGVKVSSIPIAAAGNINTPASVTIDTAGSLWIANSGNNTVTEVIGVAAPVVAPTINAVKNITLGTRP